MEYKVQKKELKWFLFNYLKIELAKKYPKLVEVVSQSFDYLLYY